MKNIRMALKLGLGFGVVLIIMCALSVMAISVVRTQREEANSIIDHYMPELAISIRLERAVRATVASMLTYTTTANNKDLVQAKMYLAEAQKQKEDAKALVAKYPQLVVLANNLKRIETNLEDYSKLVDQTASLQDLLQKQRKELSKSGGEFFNLIEELQAMWQTALEKCITTGASTEEIQLRIHNIKNINNVLEMGALIRISNFESQVMRNPAIADAGLAKFNDMLDLLKNTQSRTLTVEAKEQIGKLIALAEIYRNHLTILVEDWKELQNVATTRGAYAQQLTENAQSTALQAINNVEKLCQQATANSDSAIRLLISGMCIGVVISFILAFLLTRSIIGPLGKTVKYALHVSEGDLDYPLDICQKDEIGQLSEALSDMAAKLGQRIKDAENAMANAKAKEEEALRAQAQAEEARLQAEQAQRQGRLDAAKQLKGVVECVSSASEALSAQVTQSERGSHEQAARVSETATAMEEMNATVLEVAKNAEQTATISEQAKQKAQAGAGIVRKVIDGMSRISEGATELRNDMVELNKQAESIGAIMNVISDIADQTNLLALNAAIEAARAGEAGRGFAVVADEVRKLAEKTMAATGEVGKAIHGIQDGTAKNTENVENSTRIVAEVMDMASHSGDALSEIVRLVDQAADQIRAIATASEQQSSTSEEINRAIDDVNRISSENAIAMRQAGEAVQELSRQTQSLNEMVAQMQRG